jgi:hypothetical protein
VIIYTYLTKAGVNQIVSCNYKKITISGLYFAGFMPKKAWHNSAGLNITGMNFAHS